MTRRHNKRDDARDRERQRGSKREKAHLEIMQTQNLIQRRAQRDPLLARLLLVRDLDLDFLDRGEVDGAESVLI